MQNLTLCSINTIVTKSAHSVNITNVAVRNLSGCSSFKIETQITAVIVLHSNSGFNDSPSGNIEYIVSQSKYLCDDDLHAIKLVIVNLSEDEDNSGKIEHITNTTELIMMDSSKDKNDPGKIECTANATSQSEYLSNDGLRNVGLIEVASNKASDLHKKIGHIANVAAFSLSVGDVNITNKVQTLLLTPCFSEENVKISQQKAEQSIKDIRVMSDLMNVSAAYIFNYVV